MSLYPTNGDYLKFVKYETDKNKAKLDQIESDIYKPLPESVFSTIRAPNIAK
jgi:hypothetical protein